jgi:outer membrane lipoprotein LolB
MMRRWSTVVCYRLWTLVVTAMLSACATAPKTDIPAREPGQLQYWQASGRMAVSGVNGGGSGSFSWQQRGSEADVQLRGPIGIGSLKLLISDDALRIDTGEQVLEAGEAQAELTARLGAEVPVQALRYWLIGQAAPGEHAWLQTGDTATLEQNAWRIDYQKYGASEGVRVPTKFVASSGPAKVRIVIDRWRLHE